MRDLDVPIRCWAGDPLDHRRAHPVTAALVVEVAEPSLPLDRGVKAGLCARARLADYWIIDLTGRAVQVHRVPQPAPEAPWGRAYRSVEIVRAPARVPPLAALGSSIAVADLVP
jgi:Uma2 family endonuclease